MGHERVDGTTRRPVNKEFSLDNFFSGALSKMNANKIAAETWARVDDKIYIGGYLAACNDKFIKGENITRIVKLFADDSSYYGGDYREPGVKYLVLPTVDSPDYDIQRDAIAAMRFVRQGLARGEKILIHCQAGVSRSATIVLLYLMLYRHYPLNEAMALLRHARPIVNPNRGFMNFLMRVDRLNQSVLRVRTMPF